MQNIPIIEKTESSLANELNEEIVVEKQEINPFSETQDSDLRSEMRHLWDENGKLKIAIIKKS